MSVGMRLVPVTLLLVLIASCGKKGDSDGNAIDPEKAVTDALAPALGDMNAAYPQGLQLVLLPEGEAASLRLEEAAEGPESIADAQKEDKNRMEGKVDDCMPSVFKRAQAADASDTCYQFDQDMLFSEGTGNVPGGASTMGTKTGLDSAGKQACLVTFAQRKVARIEDEVQRATGLVSGMLCQAKKLDAKFEFPAEGAKKDLKAMLSAAGKARFNRIDVAEVERLPSVDGKAVFRSHVIVTEKSGEKRESFLTHSHLADTSDGSGEFQGSLVTVRAKDGDEKKNVLTIRYLRDKVASGEVRLKYDLRMAQVHKNVVDAALGADGTLDLNASTNAAGDHLLDGKAVGNDRNRVLSGVRQISFDIEPATGEGSFTYWENPGGNDLEKARGMIFSIAKGADGKLGGCATTGAASASIRRFIRQNKMSDLRPTGTYHPFLGDDANWQNVTLATEVDGKSFTKSAQGGSFKVWLPAVADETLAKEFAARQMANIVTRQCFVQNVDGTYEIDETKITEAAGYELLRTQGNAADAAKLLAPPALDDIRKLKTLAKE